MVSLTQVLFAITLLASSAFGLVAVTGNATILQDVPRAQYTQLNNFGSNPTNVRVWIYVPQNLKANPPLVVGLHWCHGNANDFYTGTQFKSLADSKGFIVLYPGAPSAYNGGDGCWDVHTDATLKHDAGGDSLGIISATRWTISNFGVDKSKVFAVGTSSGAMMTNVLLGAYPDIFAAGSANAGVPYACFQGPDSWNSNCADGKNVKTPQEWGDLVRSGYPGYTGTRPRIQFWHGTEDTTLRYVNFGEEIKQWTNVFGVGQTASSTTANYAVNGWTMQQFGPNVMAISAQGVDHNVPLQTNQVMSWFGL